MALSESRVFPLHSVTLVGGVEQMGGGEGTRESASEDAEREGGKF